MMAVIFIFFGLYFLLVTLLIIGWARTVTLLHTLSEKTHRISVIVPVRNEEKLMSRLLNSLIKQNYCKESLEIIIVNDHSEDATETIVRDVVTALEISNVILFQSSGYGKKAAITEGIKSASGEIIVTTDADCLMGTNWLASINRRFSSDTNLVFGAVKMEGGKSLFDKMQAIEFSSLIGSGAATLAFGTPTMCNGANLAFRKTAFLEVDGYAGNDHIASGDDEFLMRKIAAKFPESVRFNNDPETIVTTSPQPDLSAFFSQRLRWAGKWKLHRDIASKLLAVYIFLFQFLILTFPVFLFAGYLSINIFIGLMLTKIILELLFLKKVCTWLRVHWSWTVFFSLQVLYPLYAVGVGIASNFVNPGWKGRNKK